MANGTSSKCIGEIVDHAGFGEDERVAIAQGSENFWWCVLNLFGGDDVVEAVNVAVVELVIIEVILLFLPLADIGSGA